MDTFSFSPWNLAAFVVGGILALIGAVMLYDYNSWVGVIPFGFGFALHLRAGLELGLMENS